eukprot:466022-Karenia_brevis.AAC.1
MQGESAGEEWTYWGPVALPNNKGTLYPWDKEAISSEFEDAYATVRGRKVRQLYVECKAKLIDKVVVAAMQRAIANSPESAPHRLDDGTFRMRDGTVKGDGKGWSTRFQRKALAKNMPKSKATVATEQWHAPLILPRDTAPSGAAASSNDHMYNAPSGAAASSSNDHMDKTPGGENADTTTGGDNADTTPGGDNADTTTGGDNADTTPGGDN